MSNKGTILAARKKHKGIDIIYTSVYNNSMAIEKQKCLRCGAEWYPRQPEPPKTCPKCRTPYWNKPKWKQSGPKGGKK